MKCKNSEPKKIKNNVCQHIGRYAAILITMMSCFLAPTDPTDPTDITVYQGTTRTQNQEPGFLSTLTQVFAQDLTKIKHELDSTWEDKTGEPKIPTDFLMFAVRHLYPQHRDDYYALLLQITIDTAAGQDFHDKLIKLMTDLDPNFLRLFSRINPILKVIRAYTFNVVRPDPQMNELEIFHGLKNIDKNYMLMEFLHILLKPDPSLAKLILDWVLKLPSKTSTEGFVKFIGPMSYDDPRIYDPQFNLNYFNADRSKWLEFFGFLNEVYKRHLPIPISTVRITNAKGETTEYEVDKDAFAYLCETLKIFPKYSGPIEYHLALLGDTLRTDPAFAVHFGGSYDGLYDVMSDEDSFSILSPGTLELTWRSHHPVPEQQ